MKISDSTHDKLKQWPSRLKAKKTEAATTKFRREHKAVVAVVGSPAGSAHERSRASTLNVYDAADAGGYFLCHSHVTFLTEIALLFFLSLSAKSNGISNWPPEDN